MSKYDEWLIRQALTESVQFNRCAQLAIAIRHRDALRVLAAQVLAWWGVHQCEMSDQNSPDVVIKAREILTRLSGGTLL